MTRLTAQQLAALGYCLETGRRNPMRPNPPVERPAMTGGGPGREYSAHTATPETVAAASKRVTGSTKAPGGVESTASTNKYHARRTTGADGITYDSAAESRHAQELNLRRAGGDIVGWSQQPSLVVGRAENGRAIRYRADALIVHELLPNGRFVGELVDVKGKDTQASRAKRGALRALVGLDVQIARRA